MTTPSASLSVCPACAAEASGRFCSHCGTALAGAVCGTCAAPMTVGARFCHRCGTPAGSTSPAASRGLAAVLPWSVAALALTCLIALVVGQRFGAREPSSAGPTVEVLDGANGQGQTVIAPPRAPDISQLTPEQRAERLYDRIMKEHEAGRTAGVQTFLPMAVAAFAQLAPLSLDQRYDLGRIGEVSGDLALARAQSDSILRARPTHLLGLILGARVARAMGDEPHARQFEERFRSVVARERTVPLPEYLAHKTDIDAALDPALARKQ